MNIKDYSKTKINKKEKVDGKELKSVNDNYSYLVEEFMKRYGKMNEEQMMEEMFHLVEQKKKDGTFSLDELKEIAKKVGPFLDFEQQKRMAELLEKLK